jgi:hypothetical protein
MGEFINHNSALLIAVAFFGIMGMFAWERRNSAKALVVIAGITLVLVGGYWTSREGPSDVATIAEVDGILNTGIPVVLAFYSDT